ncbi:MAG: nuclease-related domain-containing protein [Verrucomicrobia bacterium]|nr:nuclease-related domain-containing protein [Verrucomicrobiota bacterium]
MTEDHPSSDHARVIGSPGERPLLAGLLRAAAPVFMIVGLAGYFFRAALPWPPLSGSAVGACFLLLAIALAFSFSISGRRLESFIKGARGEARVARILSFLPSSYTVFHGLSIPTQGEARMGGDIDHVVVGPAGIFLVETKQWRGRIELQNDRLMVDGFEPDRPPLEQVTKSSNALRAGLRTACGKPFDVLPVICFVGGAIAGGRLGHAGVVICSDTHLEQVLLEGRELPLSVEDQAAAIAYLRKQT